MIGYKREKMLITREQYICERENVFKIFRSYIPNIISGWQSWNSFKYLVSFCDK